MIGWVFASKEEVQVLTTLVLVRSYHVLYQAYRNSHKVS